MEDINLDRTAGVRSVTIVEPDTNVATDAMVVYPASDPETAQRLGPYELALAPDAAVIGDRLPLVVISHGSGGSHYTHRRLARHLARRGFVVVVPLHPGNNRDDNSRVDTVENLVARPALVRAAIDRALDDAALGPHIDARAIAMVGHSIGGYTALAIAGARPSAVPGDRVGQPADELDVVRDERVRALVLLAPATPWFMAPGALRDVRVPILMITGNRDVSTPAMHAEIVKRGVPSTTPLEHRVVHNAGHFAFLSPFPPEMQRPGFLPAQDPPGFDRDPFQSVLGDDVAAFLERVLRP